VNLTVAKVSAFTAGGALAGAAGALYAHYTTHIEHTSFTLVLATFAVVYPVLGGLYSVIGTLLAAIFVQVFLVEVLRFLGDWRSLLFGALIVLVMNVQPQGLLHRTSFDQLRRAVRRGAL
jgi:branched-chain amino acid transport system permease protein